MRRRGVEEVKSIGWQITMGCECKIWLLGFELPLRAGTVISCACSATRASIVKGDIDSTGAVGKRDLRRGAGVWGRIASAWTGPVMGSSHAFGKLNEKYEEQQVGPPTQM